MTCPAPPAARECAYEGCFKPAAPEHLHCWGHVRQRQRRKVLTELAERGRGPRRVFMEAIFDFMEVDVSDRKAWHRAWNRVRVSARRYVLADKPVGRPPRGK